jgi:hypothetical protein
MEMWFVGSNTGLVPGPSALGIKMFTYRCNRKWDNIASMVYFTLCADWDFDFVLVKCFNSLHIELQRLFGSS